MLYENEKSILATIITYPNLLDVFNGMGFDESFFSASECIITYQLICELAEDDKISWDNIIDFGFGERRITATFICRLQDKRIEVPPIGFAEKHMTIRIEEIQKDRGTRELHEIIQSKETLNDNDYDSIKEIIEKRSGIKETKENNSMGIAIKEYSEWRDIERTGILTDFPTIDNYMGDLTWGEVFAIMGRTATGKTYIALHMLKYFVKMKMQGIGFFSMEMSKSALSERIIQVYSGKHRNDIDEIDIKTTENQFKDVKIYSKVYSIFDIEGIVKRDGLKIIFIDFLQLVRGKGISLYEKATNIIQEIKALAKNMDIIVIVLVQLSRKAGEGAEEVRLDMARDSGAIEENSDFIIGIWNPEKNSNKDEGLKDVRAIKLIKNKRGMTIGAKIYFNPDTGEMREI